MSVSEAFLTTLTINGFRRADVPILFPRQETRGNLRNMDKIDGGVEGIEGVDEV